MDSQSETPKFKMCYLFDVQNKYESIVEWVLLGIVVALLLFCIYRIISFRKMKDVAKEVRHIHIFLLSWALVLTVDCVLNHVGYLQILDLDKDSTRYQDYPIMLKEVIPRLTYIFDTASALILHTVLIIIPFFWLETIIYYIEHSADPQKVSTPVCVSKILKIYLIITRILYIGFVVAQCLVPVDEFEIVVRIFKIAISSESILIIIIMFYSWRILLNNFQELAALTESSEETLMRCKTYCLMFSCLMRVGFDIVPIITFFQWTYVTDCQKDPNFIWFACFLAVGYFFTHFMPVVTILSIYKPTPQEDGDPSGILTRSMISSSMIVDNRE